MKALTIKQPWASLIILGYKRFEFRSWQTKYRGDLLIHAGLGVDKEAMKRLAKYLPTELPKGEIIGKVNLVNCIKMSPEFKEKLLEENSDIYKNSVFKENYGWQMSNIEKFDNPIKAKGHLSLWEFDLKKEVQMEYITEQNRIYAKNEDGNIVAEIDFEKVDENTYNIYHTFVDESLRGQGIANELVTRAYKEITEVRKAKVIATCSYARKWLQRKNKSCQ